MVWIVFEGGEGVGKSTQIKLLQKSLEDYGYKVVTTHEPGGTPFADEIRTLFKRYNPRQDQPTPLTELLLVMASRAQHFDKLISKHRNTPGTILLCDRFLDSSYAYQAILGGMNKQHIDIIAHMIFGDLMPDLTLVLTLSKDSAQTRILKRSHPDDGQQDRLDMSIDPHKIESAYDQIVNTPFLYPSGQAPRRIIVPGDGEPHQVQAHIHSIVFNQLIDKLPTVSRS